MTDTLSYKVPSGVSDGDLSYGSLLTAAARIEEYPRVIKGTSGEEIVTSHQVATETDIPIEARCWVNTSETGDNDKGLRILQRRKANTIDGTYTLYELTLGR